MSSLKIYDLCTYPTRQTLEKAMKAAKLDFISVALSRCKTFYEVLYRPEAKAGRQQKDYITWKLKQI